MCQRNHFIMFIVTTALQWVYYKEISSIIVNDNTTGISFIFWEGGNYMVWGYARCSTNELKQDIQRQVRELKAMGATENTIFLEYESGMKEDRKELEKLLTAVKRGDTIAATEVSRITRSTKQLCEILDTVQKVGLKLMLGTFVVDVTNGDCDPMTEGMLMMMGVFSQLERKMICQRVKSGMENAKSKGIILGRPKTTYEDIPESFFRYLPKYQNKEINKSEFSRLSELSYPSIYKYLEIVNTGN
ncbi:MAG: recombinase family protein [Ignavibacteriales bacterium]